MPAHSAALIAGVRRNNVYRFFKRHGIPIHGKRPGQIRISDLERVLGPIDPETIERANIVARATKKLSSYLVDEIEHFLTECEHADKALAELEVDHPVFQIYLNSHGSLQGRREKLQKLLRQLSIHT